MGSDYRILFVCNYYAPDSTIAAVRTTKIVKYMRRNGAHVDFLTVRNDHLDTDSSLAKESYGVNVKYAYNSEGYRRLEKAVKKLLDPVKQKKMADMSNRERINPKTGHIEFYPFETAYPIIGSVEYLLNISKQKNLFNSIKVWLDSARVYDCIITSYGDAFCYYVGMFYHKKYPKVKWIFDIRDAVYRYKFTPKYMISIAKSIERNIWRNADYIIGVSNGICEMVPGKYRKKVHKITNGYDLSDRKGLKTDLISNHKLIMTFTGSMYGGLQKLTPLFQAIADLAREGLVNLENIEIHYAGTSSACSVFRNQLNEAELGSCMVNHGKLSRIETLALQNNSDILLAPSYDYEKNKGGILTGKFFEYMSAGHPLIVIVTGDIQNSEIASITRRCKIGVVYEQAHHDRDYEGLKEWVKNAYNEKKTTGKLSYSPDFQELRKYDYRYITKKFMRVTNIDFMIKRDNIC